MRRLVASVCLAVALACAVASTAGAGAALSPRLVPIGRLHFPERGFLVEFPRHVSLDATRIRVYENGRRVEDPSFVPTQASKQRLGVVLVIDASDSMRGAPLRNAFGAARAFAARLGTHEPIGLVAFNADPQLLSGLTRDPDALRSALGSVPATASGTHVYDSVDRAIALLRAQQVAAGSVVLLSDGADTGSRTTAAAVERRARRNNIRIFSVGLRSAAFDPAALASLARGTGGTYSEAGSSAQLAGVYRAIASQLASEYVLRYRSLEGPGSDVHVFLRVVGGGSAVAAYRVPKVTGVPPFSRSFGTRFLSSAASAAVLALLVAALAAGVVFLLLRGPRSNLRERLREFVSISRDASPERPRRTVSLTKRLFGGAERSLARTSWWERFREELEIAEITISPEQIVGGALVGTFLAAFVLGQIGGAFVVFALLVPFAIRAVCKRRLRQTRERFAEQLPDNLQVFASALRAGHSFVGALAVVAADCGAPSKREFQRVVADEQLGVPVEESLRTVARRMDNPDLEQVALVAELQRQAGGNMAEVLDRVIETIRARFDLRRMITTLTAQGRMARWIVSALPVFLAGVISVINPRYIAPLFQSSAGQAALVLAGLMIVAGSMAIQKIVDIKV